MWSKGVIIVCLILVFGLFVAMRFQRVSSFIGRKIIRIIPFTVPGLPVCPDCNIVLISLDTLRADALPCYGYSRDTMPRVCAYARENIQFSNFYSQSSYTLDSHMSIFTGLYPNTHHMINPFIDELNPAIETLTQTLNKNGYRTIYAGVTGDYALPFTRGLERGFDEIHEVDTWAPSAWPRGYESIYPKLLDGTPTFVFLHTYKPHAPYLIQEDDVPLYAEKNFPNIPITESAYQRESPEFYAFVVEVFESRVSESVTVESRERNKQILDKMRHAVETNDRIGAREVLLSIGQDEIDGLHEMWYWSHIQTEDPRSIAFLRGLYDQRLHELDDSMTSLFEFLNRPEVKRKTIVIITSDHGEEFMEHGSVLHNNNIYNSTTHVPFIMSVPHARSGKYEDIAQSVDIYPTLMSLLGIKIDSPLEGVDLGPIITDPHHIPSKRFIIGQHRGNWSMSVQDGTWKLYVLDGNGLQKSLLYNLKSDKDEQNNVADTHRDVVSSLREALREALNKSPKYPMLRSEFPAWLDQLQRRNLIRDGYF